MINESSTPNDTNRPSITPEGIVAITSAVLSLIGSLGAIIYVKVKSSFRDVQNSKIKIVSSLDGDKIEGKIVINLTNDENFATTLVQGKNGKDTEDNYETVLKALVSKKDKTEKNDVETANSTQSLAQSYSDALQNNSNGDQIIAETRHDLIKYAFNAYLGVMKTLRVPLNKVADIKSLDSQYLPDNRLNGSIFFNVKEINKTQLKREEPVKKVGLKVPPNNEQQEITPPQKVTSKKYKLSEPVPQHINMENLNSTNKKQVNTTTLVQDIMLLDDTESNEDEKHDDEAEIKKDKITAF